MIGMETSFGRSGIHDWKMQRMSALILLGYTLVLAYQVYTAGSLDYSTWSGVFAPQWMRIFSFVAVVAVSIHAWAGLWIVSTDYLKPLAIRHGFQTLVLIMCVGFILWAGMIFWG